MEGGDFAGEGEGEGTMTSRGKCGAGDEVATIG